MASMLQPVFTPLPAGTQVRSKEHPEITGVILAVGQARSWWQLHRTDTFRNWSWSTAVLIDEHDKWPKDWQNIHKPIWSGDVDAHWEKYEVFHEWE
jgi:hypothetical protein